MRIYGEITKVEALDDGTIRVVGIASSGAVDDADEQVAPEAMKAALPAYMRFGALREMCVVAGFAAGWKVHDWADAQAQLKATRHVVGVVQAQGRVNDAIAVQQQATHDRIRTVTKTIIERVPSYVTAQADAHCTVPLGFVRVHDGAASGVPPVSLGSGQSADSPSGVAISSVAETVAGNYGLCNGFRQQLMGWQAWYTGQRAASGRPALGGFR